MGYKCNKRIMTVAILILISFLIICYIILHISSSKETFNISDDNKLHFTFSMKDIEEINYFYSGVINYDNKINVRLEGNGVDLSTINYYDEKVVSQNKLAFMIKTDKNNKIYDRRGYEFFVIDDSNKYNEQVRITNLARKLKLFVPDTYNAMIDINSIDYGQYIMRQAYNDDFLKDNKLTDAVIFKLNSNAGESNIHIISEEASQKEKENINNFLSDLLLNNDKDIQNYFDIDYMARLSALADRANRDNELLISENTIFIYNNFNGKIYPIIDEVALINNAKNDIINKLTKSIIGINNELFENKKEYYVSKILQIDDNDILFIEMSKDMNMQYGSNLLDKLIIGDKDAYIDNKNKIISVKLDSEASTIQNIQYQFTIKDTDIFIEPKLMNNQNEISSNKTNVTNKDEYDFSKYIFQGKLSYKNGQDYEAYDLYVTTGKLPVMVIDTLNDNGQKLIIEKKNKIECKVIMFEDKTNKYEEVVLNGGIEIKGDTISDKKNYSIKLNKSKSLDGKRESMHLVLDAANNDPSLMRKKLSLDLLQKIYEDKGTVNIVPESKFVELIINDEYRGVYTLIQGIDNKLLELSTYDKFDDFNALLFYAKNENAVFSNENKNQNIYNEKYKSFPEGVQPIDKEKDPLLGYHSGYEQKWPEIDQYGEHYIELDDFIRFVVRASDIEFEEKIFTIVDEDKLIDLWILYELQNNVNGGVDNQYLAKYKGEFGKWFFIPYSDNVFGRDEDLKEVSSDGLTTNNLFSRCMEIKDFRAKYIDRWNKLTNNGIISDRTYHEMIKHYSSLLSDAQKRDDNKWNVDIDFLSEIEYLTNWIDKRIDWLDAYFINDEV